MRTVLTSLAATAVLVTSAHAAGVAQEEFHVRAPVQHDGRAAPSSQGDERSAHPAAPAGPLRSQLFDGDSLAGDTREGIVSALPGGFRGFHGVDLSAANSAFGNMHDTPGDSPVSSMPYLAPDDPDPLGHELADRAGSAADGVPEPGTLAILSVGLAGLVVSSRKKA